MSLTRRALLSGAVAGVTASLVAGNSAFAASPLRQFAPRGSDGIDHRDFDAILAAHVRPDPAGYNRVAYRNLQAAAHGDLKAYIDRLQNARPSTYSVPEAHAFWINLYNAKTLDVVLDRYPVSSIKKINLGGGGLFGSGPWSKQLMSVEGVPLSLDDVEHRIVRPLFNDPMSHYGVNCASYSCPNIAVTAFTGANVDALLAQNAREYINHQRGVAVSNGRITASRIYAWYAGDFGGRRQLKSHWGRFAAPDHAESIRAASIGRFVYDWSLNDIA